MIPITYYPPSMQLRFEEAKKAVAGTVYEKYLRSRLVVPEGAVQAVQHGQMSLADVTLPTIEGIDRLFDSDFIAADSGYAVLDGPTGYVQSRIDFPGVTPEMMEWWFVWHSLDPRRYMLWYPYSHIEATAADPARTADESLSFAERFYNNPHQVVEMMGPEVFSAIIHFKPPEELGIDLDRMAAAGFKTSISGLLALPHAPDVIVGLMLHLFRPTESGIELVSRYYMGAHPALQRFEGAAGATELLAHAGMDAVKLESVAYELAIHDMSEWNNLAAILPGLYAEFSNAS